MEIIASNRYVKVSPRKVRLVVDAIKGLTLGKALIALSSTSKSASVPIKKTLASAIANATNNLKLEKEKLIIKSITVGEGGSFKRFHPVSRGRAHPYKKRMSHIHVVLEGVNGKQS